MEGEERSQECKYATSMVSMSGQTNVLPELDSTVWAAWIAEAASKHVASKTVEYIVESTPESTQWISVQKTRLEQEQNEGKSGATGIYC